MVAEPNKARRREPYRKQLERRGGYSYGVLRGSKSARERQWEEKEESRRRQKVRCSCAQAEIRNRAIARCVQRILVQQQEAGRERGYEFTTPSSDGMAEHFGREYGDE